MNTTYQLKRNDNFPPLRATLLQSDGRPLNISDAIVTLLATSIGVSPVRHLQCRMTTIDTTAGTVEATLAAEDVTDAMDYRAEIEVLFAGGQRVTVPNDGYFIISIMEDLG